MAQFKMIITTKDGVTFPAYQAACLSGLQNKGNIIEEYMGVPTPFPPSVPSSNVKLVYAGILQGFTSSIAQWIEFLKSTMYWEDIEESITYSKHRYLLLKVPEDMSYAYAMALLGPIRLSWENPTYVNTAYNLVRFGIDHDSALILPGIFKSNSDINTLGIYPYGWGNHVSWSMQHQVLGYKRRIVKALEVAKSLPGWKDKHSKFQSAISNIDMETTDTRTFSNYIQQGLQPKELFDLLLEKINA